MQVPFQASEAGGRSCAWIGRSGFRFPSSPQLPMSGHLDRFARPCEFEIALLFCSPSSSFVLSILFLSEIRGRLVGFRLGFGRSH